MVQRGLVDAGPALGIDRLHQVDLDSEGSAAEDEDVLIHVLSLAAGLAGGEQAEHVDPEVTQSGLLQSADCDLLYSEDSERSLLRHLCPRCPPGEPC